MDRIAVVINDITVHTEAVKNEATGMMQAHFVRKKYCVQQLADRGINAKVYIERGAGKFIELNEARMDDDVLVVGSKMNKNNWQPEPEWYDDILNKHLFKT